MDLDEDAVPAAGQREVRKEQALGVVRGPAQEEADHHSHWKIMRKLMCNGWLNRGVRIICQNHESDISVWGVSLLIRLCKMFSESFLGCQAVLQLTCCPSRQGELSENILQSLFNKLSPQTVDP